MAEVRRGTRNGRNGEEEPEIPQEMDPTGLLTALVRRIERASNNVGNNHNNNRPAPPPRQTETSYWNVSAH